MVEGMFRAMNSRDFSEFEQVLSEEVCFDFPGTDPALGKRRTLLLLKTLLRKYPVLEFRVS
jgi:hypothetical protein